MGLFDKMKEPVFLKETSSAVEQLEKLKELEPRLNEEGKIILRQDIKLLEYGMVGEKNIAFELKNCHMPMFILHDIYLEEGELGAQIDYLVFTKKLCFIIECKNLFGNIEINSAGDFIRTVEFGSNKKKEGIYSPITQNNRHLALMKKVREENRSNIILKLITEKFFEDFHKPIIVLANPKTILNVKYAKKEVRDQVIKADQLVGYIKEKCKQSKEAEKSDAELMKWAQFYLDISKEIDTDYLGKYNRYLLMPEEQSSQETSNAKDINALEYVNSNQPNAIEEMPIYKELREFRLMKSREEGIKPYYIFNNNQLEDIISKRPISLDNLKNVSGFGQAKVDKYGEDIIFIVKKYN